MQGRSRPFVFDAAHGRAGRQGRTAWSNRRSGRTGERRVTRWAAWHGIAQVAGPGGELAC
ncbi:hypothetical protein E2562_028779 [Oryza meyeriana var. granulata]|uniref:Uncharacterized protein n=1 Tax=Oryza meyeriana var. granulata TaxID=110450 RepID=A0A6G1FD24_9ORYZ|nr:hypothetical protein E2562_028779 [Oryza meyeriana var. granulata]